VLILKFRILKHTYCILISSIVFLQWKSYDTVKGDLMKTGYVG
jgi:hypothetical protein